MSRQVDAQILAIAIINRADKVITNDLNHLNKLAQGRIKVEEVPVIPVQNSFPFSRPVLPE